MDCLTAKLVNCLMAKLVNHLATKLMNRLTAKPVDRLTAKLAVVNLVKLHLTKVKLWGYEEMKNSDEKVDMGALHSAM